MEFLSYVLWDPKPSFIIYSPLLSVSLVSIYGNSCKSNGYFRLFINLELHNKMEWFLTPINKGREVTQFFY